ncbi:MAG TPA: LysR family transcriptional regulator [Candidatus Blautia faecipullorum]|nr:LysR family transcriptional regulator [Candidatus Blautia faecipullorum]
MTLLDIETFLAVVKYGNLTVAAQNLFISQPSLTRRLQLMEQELGYPLILRQKGHRTIQLTDQGKEFYKIAWKWQLLLEETNSISFSGEKEILSVASVYSVGRYFLTPVLSQFLSQKFRVRLYNAFSEDSYQHIESGLYDLAFIEQQDYIYNNTRGTLTKPAFSEPFTVISYYDIKNSNGLVSSGDLKPDQEIYVPWNNEFKAWHSLRFQNHISPSIFLEDVALLECFLTDSKWVIAPYAMGKYFENKGAHIYHLVDAPPRRIIYYLVKGTKKNIPINLLLSLLDQYLHENFENKIISLLKHNE